MQKYVKFLRTAKVWYTFSQTLQPSCTIYYTYSFVFLLYSPGEHLMCCLK